LNYEIYTIFRQAEKLTKTRNEEDANELNEYFETSAENRFIESFSSFSKNAITNFHALEAGNAEVFAIRKDIVASSLVEFKEFYDKLDISHDYTIGESFYEKIGRQCIEE
jgi:arginyl-tRNA synthetase